MCRCLLLCLHLQPWPVTALWYLLQGQGYTDLAWGTVTTDTSTLAGEDGHDIFITWALFSPGEGICSAEPLQGLCSAASQSTQTTVFLPTAFQSTWKLDAISKTTDCLTVWDIVFSLAPKNAVVQPKIQSPRNHTWFATQLFDNIKSICNILKSLANYF